MKSSRWAVVLDFDGTLIPHSYGSLYDVIDSSEEMASACHAPAQKMREYYLAKLSSGSLTAKDKKAWLADSIDLYIRAGLTRMRMESILQKVRLRSGVKECLESLRKKNIPVAIISYGVLPFIDTVLKANDAWHLVDLVYSAHLKFDNDGTLIGFDPRTMVLPGKPKGRFSRRFADHHGIPYERILAVGDSANGDGYLGHLKMNRFGIARTEEGRAKLLAVMGKAVVDTESFMPAAEWLLGKINGK